MPAPQLLDNTNMDIGFFVIPNKKSRWEDLKNGKKRVKQNAAETKTETNAN